jgi:type IV pilus biogenesis protein CpaD/CtpE
MKTPYHILIVSSVLLSACNMYAEGHLTPNRVQVEEQKFVQEIPTADLDHNYIAGVADRYYTQGDGPFDLVVTYDPRSSSNTAMKASSEMARLSKALTTQGVSDINASILPVNGQGEESQSIISFNSYNALAPKDCNVMEGVESTEVTLDQEYKMGCTVDTVFARQIARPKDLKGQAPSMETSDGRRSSNIIERYRTGTPNEPLEGETASDD